jgi:predicted GH43/DUF377 family glycosyl hydrolase
MKLRRYEGNPSLSPNPNNEWESVEDPRIVKMDEYYGFSYNSMSTP